MKRFNSSKWITENKHGKNLTEGMSPEEWADAKEKERLNQHPEKDTINKIKKMMDKENKHGKVPDGYHKMPNGEIMANKDHVDEEVMPISLQQLEKEIKDLTGEYGSVSERKPGIYRIKFSYVKQELDGRVWGDLMNLIKSHPNDYEIVDARNYYEKNWEPEEPAEQVPTIIFK
tara:strand:- start:1707 stop:2228 length:522 start_codon:yes stop_codon:yes gene_type:complete